MKMPYLPQNLLLLVLVLVTACSDSEPPSPAGRQQPLILFGACLRQWQNQPVWNSINDLSPRAFIFLGDNVYSDIAHFRNQPEPQRIGDAYAELAANPDFQLFRRRADAQHMAIFATWDDHDYGSNDAGGDYPHKLAAKQYFLDFFALQGTATGDASQAGIYQSHRLSIAGLDVQLILLDTRSFRGPLLKDPNSECSRTKIVPNRRPGATILGKRQWQWLEQVLRQPADLRLVATSIQMIPTQHCFEKWANFPDERERFFQLIRTTRASGVIVISGDRHFAEISALPAEVVGYPLYEVTASGLNSGLGMRYTLLGMDNDLRMGEPEYHNNFGGIGIQSDGDEILLQLQVFQEDGRPTARVTTPLTAISF